MNEELARGARNFLLCHKTISIRFAFYAKNSNNFYRLDVWRLDIAFICLIDVQRMINNLF